MNTTQLRIRLIDCLLHMSRKELLSVRPVIETSVQFVEEDADRGDKKKASAENDIHSLNAGKTGR